VLFAGRVRRTPSCAEILPRSRHVPKSRRGHSRGLARIEVEHAAEPLTPLDPSIRARGSRRALDHLVPQALVIPLGVVVLQVFGHASSHMRLAQRHDPIKALASDR
jgi:hypothetical protein